MNKKEQIVSDLGILTDELVSEVFDFIQYLKLKRGASNLETAILSESSLAKDWNRPEEDETWQDLWKGMSW